MWSLVPFISIIIVGSLAAASLFYVIIRLELSHLPDRPIAHWLIGANLLAAIAMLIQAALGDDPQLMFKNPNSAAALLNALWPVAAMAVTLPRSRPLPLAGGLVLVGLSALAIDLTGSRAALGGAVIALAVVAGTVATVGRDRRAASLFVAVFALVVLASEFGGIGEAAGRGVETMRAGSLNGTSRALIWEAAWEMIRQHPWLGIGPGVFWLAYPAFRPPGDTSAGFFVHNDYLQYWLENGLPGALLLVALGGVCAWLFARGLRATRDDRDLQRLGMATGSFAAIAAIASHSFFSYNLSMLPFLLMLALHLARLEAAAPPGPGWTIKLPDFRQSRTARLSLLLGVIPIVLVAMVAGSYTMSTRASQAIARGDYAAASQNLALARALWSQRDGPWYLQANVNLEAMRRADHVPLEHRRTLVAEANAMLDAARERNPLRATTPLIRGLLRADHPDLTEGDAAAAFTQALELDPRNIEARYALSQVLARNGQHEQALAVVERGLRLQYGRSATVEPLERRAAALRRDRGTSTGGPINPPQSTMEPTLGDKPLSP